MKTEINETHIRHCVCFLFYCKRRKLESDRYILAVESMLSKNAI